MKFSSRIVVALVAIVLCCAANGSAEWRIDIESKTVTPGETGVTVDITGYWDLDITQLTVPVVVRQLDGGAFWTGSLPYDTVGAPAAVGVQWNWAAPGWASLFEQVTPSLRDTLYKSDWCCIGTECDDPLYNVYDGISPDNFAVVASGLMLTEPASPAGRDFLTLTFDVNDTPGTFEFDTACFVTSLNTIFIVDYIGLVDHGPIGPGEDFDGFTKGIITIQADNEAPEWAPIPPKEVNEGDNLHFDVSASDPDSDPLTLTAEDVPTNATFTDNGDDTGTFDFNPDDTQAGIYYVRFIASDGSLEDIDTVEITVNEGNAVLETGEGMPTEYALGQNFPNPFNASTRIEFALRQGGHTKLEVFNILGQSISTLVDEYLPAGPQIAIWDGADATEKMVPSGLYFYRLTAGEYSEMKKMVLMK